MSSDLISREELLKYEATIEGFSSLRFVMIDDIKSAPSADIMECARAIKEYCKSKPDNIFACIGCPFLDERKDMSACKLFSTAPFEWDLPEGEKE